MVVIKNGRNIEAIICEDPQDTLAAAYYRDLYDKEVLDHGIEDGYAWIKRPDETLEYFCINEIIDLTI